MADTFLVEYVLENKYMRKCNLIGTTIRTISSIYCQSRNRIMIVFSDEEMIKMSAYLTGAHTRCDRNLNSYQVQHLRQHLLHLFKSS